MVSEYIPGKIRVRLDRLRESMMPPIILNPSNRYNKDSYIIDNTPCDNCAKYTVIK